MKNILAFRSELMGFSILWIMLYHSTMQFKGVFEFLAVVNRIGYTGVDIFFFLSGIGLTFSLLKNADIKAFYKKRVVRIVPTYWLFIIGAFLFFSLVNKHFVSSLGMSLLGLDFLLEGSFQIWFVPSILICYAFFPFYFKASIRFGYYQTFLFTCLLVALGCLLISNTTLSYLLIFIIRIPIFLLGCVMALQYTKTNRTPLDNKAFNALLFVAAAVLFVLVFESFEKDIKWQYGLFWYPSVLMALPICLLMSGLFSMLKQLGVNLNFLRFLGTYSLEIYLVHLAVYWFDNPLSKLISAWDPYNVITYTVLILVSVFLAFCLSRTISLGFNILSLANKTK